jgi:hypothetical protein
MFGDHSFSSVGRVRPSGPDVWPKRQPDPMGDPSNCLVQPYYHCWEGRERPIQKPYHTISAVGIGCRGSQLRMCVVGQTIMQVMTFPVLHSAGYSEICIFAFCGQAFSRRKNFSSGMGACHCVEDLSFYFLPRECGKWSSPRFCVTFVEWDFSGQLVS